jgi:cell division septation protein DedD
MITIRPSTIENNSADLPEAAPNTEEHKQRIPLAWIPVTLGIGLLIAALYLRGRIVTPHLHAKPEAAHVETPIIAKAETVAPPETNVVPPDTNVAPASPALPDPDDGVPMITPQSGDLYIQIGALNVEATRRFVQRLRNEKREPHVAIGPTPDIMRVLIGPFDNPDKLIEELSRLHSEGIDTYIRKY